MVKSKEKLSKLLIKLYIGISSHDLIFFYQESVMFMIVHSKTIWLAEMFLIININFYYCIFQVFFISDMSYNQKKKPVQRSNKSKVSVASIIT